MNVINGDSVSPSTALPSFSILVSAPGKPPTSILDCKTRHFHQHLHKNEQISTPGLDYWRTEFHLQAPFDSSFWNTVYSPLVTNKHGDLNWKVAHKALLTALRLNRMGVYASENYHRCGIMETIEHELVECPLVCHFWDLGPVSRKSRKLFGPEKPFVKLRPAYSVRPVFSYVVKGIKIKITAKFRASRRLSFEDTKIIMSPEMRPKSLGPKKPCNTDLKSP